MPDSKSAAKTPDDVFRLWVECAADALNTALLASHNTGLKTFVSTRVTDGGQQSISVNVMRPRNWSAENAG